MIDEELKARDRVNRMGSWVVVLLLTILGFLAGALVFAEIPRENQNAMLVLIGIIATNVGVVVNWLFGASASSKKQQDTIAAMADTAKSAQAALPAVPGAPANKVAPGGTVTVTMPSAEDVSDEKT